MSGAANEGVFGNPGMGRGGWGAGPGWRRDRHPSGNGNQPGWSGDYRAMWSISRPLMIAAAIVGFMVWWPIGLALLFVAIWNRRVGRLLFCGDGHGGGWSGPRSGCRSEMRRGRSSGNQAFDEYRAETLRRLEEEQGEFASFLDRLRFAKDKAEFDQFMAERRQRSTGQDTPNQPEP